MYEGRGGMNFFNHVCAAVKLWPGPYPRGPWASAPEPPGPVPPCRPVVDKMTPDAAAAGAAAADVIP
jgi:hypothetical protein